MAKTLMQQSFIYLHPNLMHSKSVYFYFRDKRNATLGLHCRKCQDIFISNEDYLVYDELGIRRRYCCHRHHLRHQSCHY